MKNISKNLQGIEYQINRRERSRLANITTQKT